MTTTQIATVVQTEAPAPWDLDSWRSKPAAQAVEYDDPEALQRACETLRHLPPLVSVEEVEQARYQFYYVAAGKAFIIQGGDCAESFLDVRYDIIRRKVELLHQQSRILEAALNKPVLRVGRIAGQYAKPRSNPLETLPSGQVVHAFRGHIINSEDETDRTPDPTRLLAGYFHAAVSHNTIRHLPTPTVYTSHEALHLPYEASLSRDDYNLSATTIWLGERTRQLNGAHVEYARGLRNPIGVKIGPSATATEIVSILNALSPNRTPAGKVTLITRFGHRRVRSVLPDLIRAVQLSGHVPIWMSDPCHGNTWTTADGHKTRQTADMLHELKETYAVHCELGSHLGGLHLEQTGDSVTECLDDRHVTKAGDLGQAYTSLCDPRLSVDQALDFVREFSEFVIDYRREQ
ncbi:phospho-2-dehydro-3-deoxyheptonate aldolase [Aspergillus spectabilis]